MKYCYHCHRLTIGDPMFCNYCGRSYEVKLCPRLHINPRTAEVCSQCGSRDLSVPEPQASVWVRLLNASFNILPGVLLLLISVLFLVAFIQAILTNPAVQGRFLVLALILGVLWWLYTKLPRFMRTGIRSGVHKLTKRKDSERHR